MQFFWISLYYSISTGLICGDRCVDEYKTCKCGKDSFQGDYEGKHYCCSNTTCQQDNFGNVECAQGKMLHISKKCDQQCPSSSTNNYIAISSCDAESCPDDYAYSTVCNLQPEKDFKDFCLDGKNCLMANNSNIAYQQCYTGKDFYLRKFVLPSRSDPADPSLRCVPSLPFVL